MHKSLYLRAFFAFLWYNIVMIDVQKTKEKLEQMTHDELVEYAIKQEITKNNYLEQLKLFRAKKYGSTSEKSNFEMITLFNEIEFEVDNTKPEELLEPVFDVQKKKKKKVKQKETDYTELEIGETIHHSLKDKTCPECGSQMKELQPTIMLELKHQPEKYYLVKHVVHNYVCPQCSLENENMMHIEPEDKPVRLIEGSIVTSSVVSEIAYNKFILGTPLYRQEQDLKRKNIPISRQNMSNWLMKTSNDYLEFVFNHMWDDFKKLEVVHLDETTLKILEDNKDGRKKGYVWLGMSGKYEEKQMALYFSPGNRKHENARIILGEDNQSIVHSDGYEAYHKDIGLMTVGCMAHVRRKFKEAQEASECDENIQKLKTKEEKLEYLESVPGYKNILIVLNHINKLFKIEKSLDDAGVSLTERYERRQKEELPIFNELFECLHKHEYEYVPDGKMGKAISYALNEEKYLRNYFKDGRSELSNNRAEQKIKPFVMARKNFLFSNTRSGAKATTIYFSLLESAKMNNLDPYRYLIYVLDTLNTKGLKDTVIESLLPYSNSLPHELYVKNKSGN